MFRNEWVYGVIFFKFDEVDGFFFFLHWNLNICICLLLLHLFAYDDLVDYVIECFVLSQFINVSLSFRFPPVCLFLDCFVIGD